MKPAAHAPTATCSGLPTPRRAFTLQAIKQGRQSGVGVGVGAVLKVRGQKPEAQAEGPRTLALLPRTQRKGVRWLSRAEAGRTRTRVQGTHERDPPSLGVNILYDFCSPGKY